MHACVTRHTFADARCRNWQCAAVMRCTHVAELRSQSCNAAGILNRSLCAQHMLRRVSCEQLPTQLWISKFRHLVPLTIHLCLLSQALCLHAQPSLLPSFTARLVPALTLPSGVVVRRPPPLCRSQVIRSCLSRSLPQRNWHPFL